MEIEQLLHQGYRYALSLTHNPAFAEDLLHDAWVSMLGISAPQNAGYLYKTIRNKFINHRKHEKIIPFINLDEAFSEGELIESESHFAELLADEQLIEKTLGELKPLEREVIYLYYYEEYTTVEIAELIGQSKGVVCSLIYRTRIKLRDLIENETRQVAL